MALNKNIVLGSGKLYCAEFSNSIPDNKTLETEDNILGLIKGGATLSYEPEFYTAQDDLGLAVKKMITKETAILKSGIMTWNSDTLGKLCSTAKVTSGSGSQKIVKIGGVGNYDGKQYVLRFVHEGGAPEETLRVTIVGSNEAGFEIAFSPEEETVIDAEFTAFPMDDKGTLIEVAFGNPAA